MSLFDVMEPCIPNELAELMLAAVTDEDPRKVNLTSMAGEFLDRKK